MSKIKILWADDEIEMLKPHVLFLENKGYIVSTAISGDSALELIESERFDIMLLDENMPGLSGLETLEKVKSLQPAMPVIMITKSEEESIMEEAIGSKISDYLIKPVNPNQILLSLKKNLDTNRLISEKTASDYQMEFRNIGMRLNEDLDHEEWREVYQKLVHWELELDNTEEVGMEEVLLMQKSEANLQFSRFIRNNYAHWLKNPEDAPVMSHTLIDREVIPNINNDSPLFLVIIDNLRYDQWKVLKPIISDMFWIDKEDTFFSILPSTTQYSRNALFAGLMPSEIEKLHPQMWLNDDEQGGKNNFEKDLLQQHLKRVGKSVDFSYNKVLNINYGKKLVERIPGMMKNPLNVIIYNFVDMLSHARTDTEIIRELASDESAYRSVTLSWFEHSPLLESLREIARRKGRVIIATDHGSVLVKEATKVVGDKETNPNLRYKQGKNLNYEAKEVIEFKNPEEIFLPRINVSQSFVFAGEDHFFAYPNNFNHYVKYYKDTFQHGGVSLEEMIIPLVHLSPK
ncbi:MAG: PglZ domain-containing protein [Vicingaceae bacterium]